MSAIAHRGATTIRLPDGTVAGVYVIDFDADKGFEGTIVLPSGVVRWEHVNAALGMTEDWLCHFSRCLTEECATGKQYAPQYDKPPVLLSRMTVMSNTVYVDRGRNAP